MPCCKRRGISKSCAPLCQSVSQVSTGTHWSDCGHEMGFIFMCYEEGAQVLPPPITDFVAARVDNHGVCSSHFLSFYFAHGDFNAKYLKF